VNEPFQPVQVNSPTMKHLERFTCILCDKTTPLTSVNKLRQELFCKQAKMMEKIPPTQVMELILYSILPFKTFCLLFSNTQTGPYIRQVYGPPVCRSYKTFLHLKKLVGLAVNSHGSLCGLSCLKWQKLVESRSNVAVNQTHYVPEDASVEQQGFLALLPANVVVTVNTDKYLIYNVCFFNFAIVFLLVTKI